MAKIFDWLKPTSNPNTNGFDVSKRQTFSLSCGMQIPALCRIMSPKSHGKISLGNSIINSLPMLNQPFNRGQFVLDFYQVPFKQIMSRFDEFYTQLQEPFSSDDNLENVPQIPHVDLWTLSCMLAHDVALDFILAGSYHSTGSGQNVSYYLDWVGSLNPTNVTSQISKFILGMDVHGIPRAFGTLRLLDMLGYGNFYLLLKEYTLVHGSTVDPNSDADLWAGTFGWNFGKYVFDSMIDGEDISEVYYNAVDDLFSHGYSQTYEPYVNYHNLNDFNLHNYVEGKNYPPKLLANALSLFAYQKVFNDIYRNSFYDSSNVYAFNCDHYVNNFGETGSAVLEILDDLFFVFPSSSSDLRKRFAVFELRYRQFKKDMFTSLLPNSQFGDVSVVNVGDSVFNLQITNNVSSTSVGLPLGVNSNDSEKSVRFAGSGASGYATVADFTSKNLTFSVLMQRRAEALQKYKERFLRAGNRLKDQYISTFGKVPYYLEDKYVRYLGSIDNRLEVQGVPATSDSGSYDVGERGSYGYSGIRGNVEFACDDWSFVIGIFYYLPELDYQSFGLEADKKFSEFSDFIVPEFENLGLEPVYRSTLSLLGTLVSGSSTPIGGERVVGYGPSYMYFKTDIDKVHGEFGSTNEINGVFSSWVTSRGNVSMSDLSDYYVKPDFCNSVFRQQFRGTMDTDPFLAVLDFDFKVVEPLSVVGLPIWN